MRFVLAMPVFLAGCAAPSGWRFVLLESESYGCGAAEGLGCGLAIAPVLHRIDDIEGVAESSVSWDGRLFRIEVLPGVDRERVVAEASALLEGEPCCVTASRGKATPAQPDHWFNEEQTVALSRHEAGVIASDFFTRIAAEITLDDDLAERLQAVLREELERSFEQAHASAGGVNRLWEQLPAAWPRFEARIAEFLTPEQSEQVSAILARELDE